VNDLFLHDQDDSRLSNPEFTGSDDLDHALEEDQDFDGFDDMIGGPRGQDSVYHDDIGEDMDYSWMNQVIEDEHNAAYDIASTYGKIDRLHSITGM
jgi:hypothetical protein